MSMPKIIGSDTTREQSITDIISSVSLEQTALSHVLNAEGEKLQALMEMQSVTTEELLTINNSVTDTVESIIQLESMLMSKLKLFGNKLKPPAPIKFYFNKIASDTSAGLTGAEFDLYYSGVVVESATSLRGRVTFRKQHPGTYILKERIAPIGYQPDTTTEYTVIIGEDRSVTINGTIAEEFTVLNVPYPNLTVYKVSDLNTPLSDGEFLLENGSYSYKGKSGDDGIALLERIMPGDYILSETRTHNGYRKSEETHTVSESPDGTFTIDSIPTSSITIKNKELIDIAIRLFFFDSNDAGGYRPDNVYIDLFLNDVFYFNYTFAAYDNSYCYIHKVEKYDDSGNLNKITFIQTGIPYYRTDYDYVDYTIINTLELMDVSGTVFWKDNNNENNKRPQTVTITLFDNGDYVDIITISELDEWKYSFKGVPISAGYQVIEDGIPSYQITYGGNNNWDITNRYLVLS